jgi:dihydroorotase
MFDSNLLLDGEMTDEHEIDYRETIQALQARIDELMFEYCQDEMTPEQIHEYVRHQVPIEPGIIVHTQV